MIDENRVSQRLARQVMAVRGGAESAIIHAAKWQSDLDVETQKGEKRVMYDRDMAGYPGFESSFYLTGELKLKSSLLLNTILEDNAFLRAAGVGVEKLASGDRRMLGVALNKVFSKVTKQSATWGEDLAEEAFEFFAKVLKEKSRKLGDERNGKVNLVVSYEDIIVKVSDVNVRKANGNMVVLFEVSFYYEDFLEVEEDF